MSKEILNGIGQPFGKEGLRFLFVFKIIKQHVQQELQREGKKQPAESILNKICANVAKEMLINNQETPSEKDINDAVMSAKRKLDKP